MLFLVVFRLGLGFPVVFLHVLVFVVFGGLLASSLFCLLVYVTAVGCFVCVAGLLLWIVFGL